MFYAIYLCEQATTYEEIGTAGATFHQVVDNIITECYDGSRDRMMDCSWINAPGYSDILDSNILMQ